LDTVIKKYLSDPESLGRDLVSDEEPNLEVELRGRKAPPTLGAETDSPSFKYFQTFSWALLPNSVRKWNYGRSIRSLP